MIESKDGVGKVNLITEESCNINNILIRKATSTGNITFSTSSFSRGTNFVCTDKEVLANGGVHII